MRWMLAMGLVGCASGIDPELQAKFDASCAACHVAGAADAPRPHERRDWDQRIRLRGRDGLVRSAMAGRIAMPARGRCADCSDADIEALVHWMSQ